MKRYLASAIGLVVIVLAAALAIVASPASAHTPSISASCDGVHVSGTNYEADKTNTWSVTIGGVEQHGTFGASFDQTFPVPQGGKSTAWSATIQAQDGGYKGTDSGTVGPCGETPPPPVSTPTPTPPAPHPPTPHPPKHHHSVTPSEPSAPLLPETGA